MYQLTWDIEEQNEMYTDVVCVHCMLKQRLCPHALHFDAHLLSLSVCAGPDLSYKEMMGDVCLKHVKRPLCA